MGLAWPLGAHSHSAVQLVVTVFGVVMVVSGIVLLFRLVSEQEKHVAELQNQLNAKGSCDEH